MHLLVWSVCVRCLVCLLCCCCLAAMADDAYDPLGLGIAGIGVGGYASSFATSSTISLTAGDGRDREQLAAVHNAAARKRTVAELVERLQSRRGKHSWADFAHIAAIDIAAPANAKLLDDLKKNSKVELDTQNRTIAFKPTLADVGERKDVLVKVGQHPFGIAEEHFMDAYPGVDSDIRELVAGGDIYQLTSQQTAKAAAAAAAAAASSLATAPLPAARALQKDRYSILYPRRRQYEVGMSSALVSAWHATTVPSNPADLDELLVRHGLMTAAQAKAAVLAQSALAKLEIKRKKKLASLPQRKRYRQQHLTNTHLIGEKGYDFLKPTANNARR